MLHSDGIALSRAVGEPVRPCRPRQAAPTILTVSPLCPGCPGSPSLPGGPCRKEPEEEVSFSSEKHHVQWDVMLHGNKNYHCLSGSRPWGFL